MIDSGLRYCTAHSGKVDVDEDSCDFQIDPSNECPQCEGEGSVVEHMPETPAPERVCCSACDGFGYTPCVLHKLYYREGES